MKASCESFDLAVIGGGSAGLAAAVTAARQGARTLLVERYGYLGGMGTASLVHSFCGLYLLRKEAGAVLANPGFSEEIASRMIAATGIGPKRMGRVDVLPQHPVEFVRIADEMTVAEAGLEVRLHSKVTDLQRSDEGWSLQIGGRCDRNQIFAARLIDASGDAVVAELLGGGAAMAESPVLQRPAYVFGVHCHAELDDAFKLQTAGMIVDGVKAGEIPQDAMGITFRASGRTGEVFASLDLTGGATVADFSPLDSVCLTQLELSGRRTATAVMRWLGTCSDLWRGSYISQWPVRAGIRESRRWIGESILTGEQVFAGERFSDEIALATWPMEFREDAKGPKLRFPLDDRPTGIPLGCLRPLGIDKLWVAGRCISADHAAQASIRVMGTCFATGEAAGRAALQ
jgi:hypothetical protein